MLAWGPEKSFTPAVGLANPWRHPQVAIREGAVCRQEMSKLFYTEGHIQLTSILTGVG